MLTKLNHPHFNPFSRLTNKKNNKGKLLICNTRRRRLPQRKRLICAIHQHSQI